jgi:zinc protease
MTRTLLTLTAALAVGAVTAFAQVKPPISGVEGRSVQLGLPLAVDPDVTVGTLPNGLTYYIRKNAKPEKRAEIMLAVKAGSVLEHPDQQGLAHFVEHMAFNGTKNFPKNDLVDYLESTGMRFGADLNAYTTFDQTVYMLQVPTDTAEVLRKGFQILEDWAHNLSFDDTEIDKERGVVVEEWRSGRGAGNRIFNQQFPVLTEGSRYAERITIGKKAVLDTFHHDVLRSFYHDWYRPDLMAVIAVGDFDKGQVERYIREHFSGIADPAGEQERPVFSVPDHDGTRFSVVSDPEASTTDVSVYFLKDAPRLRDNTDYRNHLIEALFSGMLRDRLSELTQKPDPPFLFASAFSGRLVLTRGMNVLTATAPDNGAERALEALLTEAERVRKYGFTQAELDRNKVEMMRGIERAYAERTKTDSRVYANSYVSKFMTGEPPTSIALEYDLSKAYLNGITLDEVNRLSSEWITDHDRVVEVSGPRKEGVALPDTNRLKSVLAAVDAKEIAPYVDNVSSEPLLPKSPKPGKIVSRRQLGDVGVTEWTLSNGVRVALKPTDFKADEVRLTAFSPGGTSLVPDSLYHDASVAAGIVDESGLGSFDNIALQKKLAGKVANASPYINELREGISGYASPKDLETMFQMIYLYFTAPRRDSSAFQVMKAREEGLLRNRSSIPEVVFGDSLQSIVWNNHFRSRPWTARTWESIDLDRALAIYRNRFADASDFTFVIVGSFDTATIRPMIETYLGGLPATHRTERWRDVGMELTSGVKTRTVTKGLEPKSAVRIIFTGPFDWSLKNRYAMQSAVEVLRIKLREALREDKGGTYSPGVGAQPMHAPKERYLLSVSFGCSPDRVDELTKAALEQIEILKRDGPTESELSKVREIQRRGLETSMKQNDYWLAQIQNSYINEEDLDANVHMNGLIDGLNAATVKEAARKYFDEKNMTTMILLPETTRMPDSTQ